MIQKRKMKTTFRKTLGNKNMEKEEQYLEGSRDFVEALGFNPIKQKEHKEIERKIVKFKTKQKCRKGHNSKRDLLKNNDDRCEH